MLGFRWRWATSAVVALGLGGCANLGPVPATCGNGVVEDGKGGEDCDQNDDATSGNACGKPDTAGACRFICSSTIACPGGWACGLDGICRRPIPRSWTSTGVLVPESAASDLLVDDFDSDGIDDVVAVAPPSVALHFFEASRSSTASTSLVDSEPGAAVGHLTAKAGYGPSLMLDLSRGLGVFTGQTDRSLQPVVYPTLAFPGQTDQLAPFLIDVPGEPTGFLAYGSSGINAFMPAAAAPTPIDTFTANQIQVGSGAVGRFQPTQGCEWLALALNDVVPPQGHVRVYSGCAPTPLITDVMLPLGTVAACEKAPCTGTATRFHPLHIYDVNGDGLNDLVVARTLLGNLTLHVAYSYGNGQFGSTPPPSTPGPADDTFSPPFVNLMAGNGVPLAIGDVDGDGTLDIVDPSGIYLGKTAATSPLELTATAATPDGGRMWSEAVVADLNADGRVDVAVGSSDYPGITLYRGTGTAFFNPVDIVTPAGIRYLEVGDFDGDLVDDLVFSAVGATEAGSTTAAVDTLYISFGVQSGPPADPVAIGNVTGVTQIAPAYESEIYPSLIRDAFVVGFDAKTMGSDVYLFPGDTSRQIETPYFLIQPGVSTIDGPRRSVLGSFSGRAGHGDADVAVFAKPFTCATCVARLWLLPTQGGGAIEAVGTSDTASPLPITLSGTLKLADDALLGNLGPPPGSPSDALVMVAPTLTGTAVITGSTPAGGTFALGAEAPLAGFYLTGDTGGVTPMGGPSAARVDARLLTADVNGDGHRDLVLASPRSGLAVVLGAATGGLPSTLSALTLTYEALDGVCSGSGPPGGGATMLHATIGATALAAGTDKTQEIVLTVTNGTVLVGYDAEAQQLATTCLTGIGTGTAVAAGDFDGDGIEDIVVSQSSGLNVYYGQSQKPGATVAAGGGGP